MRTDNPNNNNIRRQQQPFVEFLSPSLETKRENISNRTRHVSRYLLVHYTHTHTLTGACFTYYCVAVACTRLFSPVRCDIVCFCCCSLSVLSLLEFSIATLVLCISFWPSFLRLRPSIQGRRRHHHIPHTPAAALILLQANNAPYTHTHTHTST